MHYTCITGVAGHLVLREMYILLFIVLNELVNCSGDKGISFTDHCAEQIG